VKRETLFLTLLALGLSPAASVAQQKNRVATQPANASVSRLRRPTKDEIPKLIAVLNDLSYAVRTEATQRLELCDQADLVGPLAEAYRGDSDFETRLRIRKIARDVFLRQFETGFLGIQMRPVSGGQQNRDDRLKPKQNAILVVAVLPGTAADMAGVQSGDLITDIDGVPVPFDGRGSKFSQIISSHKAGETVALGLVRDRPMRVKVMLGGRKVEYWTDANGLPDQERIEKAEKKLTQWWAEHFEPNPPASQQPLRLPFPSIK